MLALLHRLRDHVSARRGARAPSHCMTSSASHSLTLHQQAIEHDGIAWAYKMLAPDDAVDLADLEPIDALLEQLAPAELLIVDAWFRRELTCQEIAAAQGISVDEARARVHDVLKTLSDAGS